MLLPNPLSLPTATTSSKPPNNVQYILDEKVEQALNKSLVPWIFGLQWKNSGSHFEFPWTDEKGVEKKLTEEEIRAFAKNPDRDIRRRAAESMNSVYPSIRIRSRSAISTRAIGKLELFDGTPRLQDSDEQAQYQRTSTRQCRRYTHVRSAEILSALSAISPCKTKASWLPELYGYDVHAPIFKIEKKIPTKKHAKLSSICSRIW